MFGTTLATLVGMIALYKSERKNVKDASIDSFLEWLRRHNHDQLVDLLVDNKMLSKALFEVIALNQNTLTDKLNRIDHGIALITKNIQEFESVSEAIGAQSRLSEQAYSILYQLNIVKASSFIELNTVDEGRIFSTDASSELVITEPQFITDDLQQLCDAGSLLHSEGRHNTNTYTITRLGVELSKQYAPAGPKITPKITSGPKLHYLT